MTSGVQLLLVDDHPLFRDGFQAMILHGRPGWVLDHAGGGADALKALTPNHHMVIIDINLPDMDGFEAMRAIADLSPLTPRVMISGREDIAVFRKSREAGACGFISKGWPTERVLCLLDLVLAGGSGFEEQGAEAIGESLTSRQLDVLGLVAEGCSNKMIERRMNIAARTVRAHLTVIFAHLGAEGRMQAVIEARRRGLVD